VAAVARQLCNSTPGKRAAYCQPVAFIIAAIVAPTAKSRRGRNLMVEVGVAFQCAGEMSSTHHELIF
jgi:hypothetical protein